MLVVHVNVTTNFRQASITSITAERAHRIIPYTLLRITGFLYNVENVPASMCHDVYNMNVITA